MEEIMVIQDEEKREELHVMYMKKKAEDGGSRQSSNYSPIIYKVPRTLRLCDKAAYEPQIISIGPYHCRRRGKKRLRAIERHKWLYLHDFLSRNTHRSLGDYYKEIKNLEEQVRGCYSEEILLNRLELTEVMVLDGCFAIELFLKLWDGRAAKAKEAKEYDPVYSHSWVENCVAHDLLLFENQLPFFILDSLYCLLEVSTPPLVEIALNFFSNWNFYCVRPTVMPESQSVHHLLHLLHFNLFYPPIPSNIPPSPPTTRLIRNISRFCSHLFRARKDKLLPTHSQLWSESFVGTILSATRLKDAGITFCEQKMPKSLLDITFSSGKMKIPCLCVEDRTNSLFRNLAAFEQCVPSAGDEFTIYVLFMVNILNTGQDVEILRSHGIIENLLGSDEEVALLFNRMCTGILSGDEETQISLVMKEAKAYTETKRHAQRAKLMRDYFGSPWSFISVMAAAFVILLTLLQTIIAFLSYFQGSS